MATQHVPNNQLSCTIRKQEQRTGTLFPLRGLESAMPISVIPYRSSKVCPAICCHRLMVPEGNAMDPLTWVNMNKESKNQLIQS
jgi:hypothetical protein